jgi:hypothetical protein
VANCPDGHPYLRVRILSTDELDGTITFSTEWVPGGEQIITWEKHKFLNTFEKRR